jgi:hypothetical protein
MERKKKKKTNLLLILIFEFGPDFFLFFQIIKLSQVQELDILGFEENGQSQLRSDQIKFGFKIYLDAKTQFLAFAEQEYVVVVAMNLTQLEGGKNKEQARVQNLLDF